MRESKTWLLVATATFFILLAGCTSQLNVKGWSSSMPTAYTDLYPRVVTSGDILEVRYYLEGQPDNTPYLLGVGDVVRVEVLNHPELTREEAVILPDGTISLPLIGMTSIAGKSVDQACQLIEAKYVTRKIKDPEAELSVLQGQRKLKSLMESLHGENGGSLMEISVYGNTPLALPFIEPIEVGRPLEEIRRDIKEQYAREFGSQLELVVNLRAREEPSVHIMGEVKKPGSIKMSMPLNPITAIAASGGFTDAADPTQVAVIRFAGDNSYQRWVFNLSEQINESDAEHHMFALGNNDVVLVVKSGIANANVWMDQYIRKMIPINFGVNIPVETGW